jgi:hypothetical protein
MSGKIAREKGILKIFLSSTFKDLRETRGELVDRLDAALEGAAMEKFISGGSGPQRRALQELHDSEIAVYLISPYYGTNIQNCECGEKCKAECCMKNSDEKISYTWCEYRFGLAESKLRMSYIVDDGWGRTSRDGAPTLWAFRDEIEYKEFCPRIKSNGSGVEKVLTDLASNIIDWYSAGKLDLNRFCGRRDLLRDLVTKMHKSVEVTGVGGIGKTALCEVALLVYKLLGRKIVYVGLEEGYASGTGYEYATEKIPAQRFSEPTLDTVAHALDFGAEFKDLKEGTKIAAILQQLDARSIILFIDNFNENEGLKKLIRRSNSLNSGCIMVSAIPELRLAVNRVPVKNIEKTERSRLNEIMGDRVGKRLSEEESKRIQEIAEGHPVAAYLLISNLGRVPIEMMANFKEGLTLSQENDIKEYMSRVIERSISPRAHLLLKELSVIAEEMDRDCIYAAGSSIYPSFPDLVGELLDIYIERVGSKIVWKYNQIREAVFEDKPERYRLAASYYGKRLDKSSTVENEIKMLYYLTKYRYTNEIFGSFLSLAYSIKEGDPAFGLLPLLGAEIIKYIGVKEKATVYSILGFIYAKIALYRDKAENCKKSNCRL